MAFTDDDNILQDPNRPRVPQATQGVGTGINWSDPYRSMFAPQPYGGDTGAPPNINSPASTLAPGPIPSSSGGPVNPMDRLLGDYTKSVGDVSALEKAGPDQFHPSFWRRLAGAGLGTLAGIGGGRQGYGRYSYYSGDPKEAFNIAREFTYGPQGRMNADYQRRLEAAKGTAEGARQTYEMTRQSNADQETAARDALNRENIQSEIASRVRPQLVFDDNGKAYWSDPIKGTVTPALISQGDITQFPGGDGQLPQQLTKAPPPTLTDVNIPGEGNRKVLVQTRGTNKGNIQDVAASKAPEERPGAQDTRVDRSYQFHTKELDNVAKPITDRSDRIQRLLISLRSNSPQADALLAPELLTSMAGGQGSGLRMNEAEIARIVNGRSNWQTLQAMVNKWKDPKDALSIPPEQKAQMMTLVQAMQQRVTAKQSILEQAQQKLADSNDPKEHKQIYAQTKSLLDAIDNNYQGVDKRTGRSVFKFKGGYIYDDGSQVPK